MIKIRKVLNKWKLEDYKLNQQNHIYLDEDGLIDTYKKIQEELKKLGYFDEVVKKG